MDEPPADPTNPDRPRPFSLVLLDTLPWALLKRPVLLVAAAHPPSADSVVVVLNEAELSLDAQQRLLYGGRRPSLVYLHDPTGQMWAFSQPLALDDQQATPA